VYRNLASRGPDHAALRGYAHLYVFSNPSSSLNEVRSCSRRADMNGSFLKQLKPAIEMHAFDRQQQMRLHR